MEFEITKIDAAVAQLDWAIRLFLDQNAYIPAITLAGAAEELLGKTAADRAAFGQLKNKFALKFSLPESEISQNYLNKARNWLKHWDDRTDAEVVWLELDDEAIQYILRALANLAAHDGTLPSEGPRFIVWLKRNRPRLWKNAAHRPPVFDALFDAG
jgi:hypothetical protein